MPSACRTLAPLLLDIEVVNQNRCFFGSSGRVPRSEPVSGALLSDRGWLLVSSFFSPAFRRQKNTACFSLSATWMGEQACRHIIGGGGAAAVECYGCEFCDLESRFGCYPRLPKMIWIRKSCFRGPLGYSLLRDQPCAADTNRRWSFVAELGPGAPVTARRQWAVEQVGAYSASTHAVIYGRSRRSRGAN